MLFPRFVPKTVPVCPDAAADADTDWSCRGTTALAWVDTILASFRGAVGIDSDNLDDRDPAKVSSATKQTNEPKSKHTNKQPSKQAGEGHFTAPCEVTLAE